MAFKIGQIVQLRVDRSRQGSIIEILQEVGGVSKYRVFHSASDIREYFEDQLTLFESNRTTSNFVSPLVHREWLSSDRFRARITAARLSNPQADSLYSLHAARVHYIPFQFKPLLRFLRAEQPRLLIADEVGVGKTIEAGLILRELQSRQEVENVLIVCPKALVSKWQAEMRRFDEDFRPLTSENLRYCINETNLDGVWPAQYARSIVHLELLRNQNYILGTDTPRFKPGLLTLNPPPQFSLVIFDEAHHLRNMDTNSYEVARFLCDVSEAVVLLSATPVHLGSENLYVLLQLLRPDLLPDFVVFQQMMEPNPHLIRAMSHIRTRLPRENWQVDTLSAIDEALNTDWGEKVLQYDQRVSSWKARLSEQSDLNDEERVRFLRDLEDVHTLAHLMNRTRRRDIGQFTIREPHTIRVSFTQLQQQFYDLLIEFRRRVLALHYDPLVIRLITDTLERQASSCLPALVPLLDVFIRTGRFSSIGITDDLEFEEDTLDLPSPLISMAQELRERASNLSPDDPKFDQLTEIVGNVLEFSRPKKVLLFSFFLHTLRYLEQNLSLAGYRVRSITGNTDEEDRQLLRQRFRLPHEHPEAIDILLSSEVGCEGLDYEFCDCLVNYDIPWNPMRIEQRIGRIDRFGQKSDKVLIYNFITPGTVEERIFFRCFERLGVFRDSVGDLEEVLGQVVQNLTQVAFDPMLTIEQAEEKAQQMADNAIRLVEEQRRLEAESESLLGLNRSFLEEIDTLIQEGRFVAPADLEYMVTLFVEQTEIGGRISSDSQHPGNHKLRLNKEARSTILNKVSELSRYDRATIDFMRWLQGNEPTLSITFSQEVALDQRQIPFITPIHALAQAAIVYWNNMLTPLVTNLLCRDSSLKMGSYLFILDLWETVGVQAEVRLVGFAWDIHKDTLSKDISPMLLKIFEIAKDGQEDNFPTDDVIRTCLEAVDEAANQARLKALQELKQRNEYMLARRLASLEGYYRNRLTRVDDELRQSTDERIHRMKQAEKSRIEADFARKRIEIERRSESDILSQRIAVGMLQVHGDDYAD